jgi:hypothetical protein
VVGRFENSVKYWELNFKHLKKAIECHLFPPAPAAAKRRKKGKKVVDSAEVVRVAPAAEEVLAGARRAVARSGGAVQNVVDSAVVASAAAGRALMASGGAAQTAKPVLPLEELMEMALDAECLRGASQTPLPTSNQTLEALKAPASDPQAPDAPAAKTTALAAPGQTPVASPPASTPTVYSVVLTPLT